MRILKVVGVPNWRKAHPKLEPKHHPGQNWGKPHTGAKRRP